MSPPDRPTLPYGVYRVAPAPGSQVESEATRRPSSVALEQESELVPASVPQSPALERHFTVAEVAALWGLSQDAIRKLFEREPGVLALGNEQGNEQGQRKRRYITLRIPESVVERIHRQYSLGGQHPER